MEYLFDSLLHMDWRDNFNALYRECYSLKFLDLLLQLVYYKIKVYFKIVS